MKRKSKNYSLIILGILFTCNVLSQNLNEIRPFRVIVKFDKEIFSSNTEITNVQEIQSESIKEVMEYFSVKTVRAVFRNRYDNNGILKTTIAKTVEQLNDLNCWQEIIMTNITKSQELIEMLNSKSGVYTAYIEYPVVIKPCMNRMMMNMEINGI